MSHDEISNPAHYDLFPDGMQAIDVIRAALTPEEFSGYCKGNFLKYRLRAGEKGPAEKCIGKSEWHRTELREHHADTLATNVAEKPLDAAQDADSTVALDRSSELLNSFEHHARKLAYWKHCMSGNDSYFGEPAGLVKQIAYELDRLIGKPRTAGQPADWPNEQRRQDADDVVIWPTEERIDVIGSNGNDGLHYPQKCACDQCECLQ